MKQPLYVGSHHRDLIGREEQGAHPQYLSKMSYERFLETLVPAAKFGALPGMSGTAATDAINGVLSIAPEGSTVFFQPGTYTPGGPITHSRKVNIMAPGVTWNFGSASLASAAFTIGSNAAAEADQLSRISVSGLKIVRTYTKDYTNLVNGPRYTGFEIIGPNRCVFEDLIVEGFDYGFYMHGSFTGANKGYSENAHIRCIALNNRWSFRSNSQSAAYFTDNYFERCEHQHETDFGSSSSDGTNGAVACALLWNGTNTPPNNNLFVECNWEGPDGYPLRRKVIAEGRNNVWMNCRWETHNVSAKDVTLGSDTLPRTNITRNLFFHGNGLETIVDDGLWEFKASDVALNNKNQFITAWGSVWSGGNSEPLLKLYGSTRLIEAWSTLGGVLTKRLHLHSDFDDPGHFMDGNYGPIEWFDATGLVRKNALAYNASEDYLDIERNFRVADRIGFEADGWNAKVFPVKPGAAAGLGYIDLRGGSASSPPVYIRNTGSSGYPSLWLGYLSATGTADRVMMQYTAVRRIDPDQAFSWQNVWEVRDSSNNVRNYIALYPNNTSTGPAEAAGLRPILFDRMGLRCIGALAYSERFVDLVAPPDLAASYTLTLPPNDGASGQVLSTNGSGVTSWVDQTGGAGGYYEPLTNGDVANPELIFADGDVIMVAG